MTRTRRATGEALLLPPRKRRSKVDRITGDPGKSAEEERVAEGSVVAKKQGNACGAKGPYCVTSSDNMEGRGEMIKHLSVCKTCAGGYTVRRRLNRPGGFGAYMSMSVRRKRYRKRTDWPRRITAPREVTASRLRPLRSGVEAFLEQLRDELLTHTYRPSGYDARRYRRQAAKVSAFSRCPRFVIASSRVP